MLVRIFQKSPNLKKFKFKLSAMSKGWLKLILEQLLASCRTLEHLTWDYYIKSEKSLAGLRDHPTLRHLKFCNATAEMILHIPTNIETLFIKRIASMECTILPLLKTIAALPHLKKCHLGISGWMLVLEASLTVLKSCRALVYLKIGPIAYGSSVKLVSLLHGWTALRKMKLSPVDQMYLSENGFTQESGFISGKQYPENKSVISYDITDYDNSSNTKTLFLYFHHSRAM